MPPRDAVKRYTSDVRLQPWSHLRVWLFCGGVLMLLYGLARDPAWVEQDYVEGYGATIASWLAWISAPVPVSIAEILVVLLALWLVWSFLTGLAEVGAGRRQLRNAVTNAVMVVLDLALFLGAWFYLSWGVAYARPPAAERFDLPVAEVTGLGEGESIALLRQLALAATERTNQAYREVHDSADAGEVTVPKAGFDVDAALERAFARLAEARKLSPAFAAPRGPAKTPFLSVAMSYVGIAGVYAPFTGEANVNGGPPAWTRIGTLAHEKAHQRLVTSEDEATFVGVLALLHSDEPLLRYVGWQEVRWQLQRAAVRRDPASLSAFEGKLAAGPQRDVIARTEFWQRYEGPMEHVGTQVNDGYLKLHHVEGGVDSYVRASVLMEAWSRTDEGRALFAHGKTKG